MNIDESILEELPDSIIDATAEAIGEALDCTRVWSAWSYGTMSQNDFCSASENSERVVEIAQAAIRAYIEFLKENRND